MTCTCRTNLPSPWWRCRSGQSKKIYFFFIGRRPARAHTHKAAQRLHHQRPSIDTDCPRRLMDASTPSMPQTRCGHAHIPTCMAEVMWPPSSLFARACVLRSVHSDCDAGQPCPGTKALGGTTRTRYGWCADHGQVQGMRSIPRRSHTTEHPSSDTSLVRNLVVLWPTSCRQGQPCKTWHTSHETSAISRPMLKALSH